MGWCTEIKPQTDAFPNYSCGTSHLQPPHPDFQGCWSSCLHFGKLPASTDKLMKQFLVQLFCFNSLLSADLAPWPDLTRLTNPGLCLITLIGLSYSVKSELGVKSWSSAPPPWLILLLPGWGVKMILPCQWAVPWLCCSPHTQTTVSTFVLAEHNSMVEREVKTN